MALDVTVVSSAGGNVSNFRWLLEEDNTAPGVPGSPSSESISLIIHKSHAPVVATGTGASITIPGPNNTVVDPASTGKRYLLSVLAEGYSLGGASVAAGQTSVRVVLNAHEIPTAQISVLAFNDNNPINNVPDAGEAGIPGCKVVLSDFLGGPILTDTFGNPLGTTYRMTAGEFDMVDGAPVVLTRGSGAVYTDANGKALIKNLAMGKYGVQVIPPHGSDWTGGHGSSPKVGGAWSQTSTIEGTPTVDAWVKANEPRVFTEGFGPGTYHTFFGFVDPTKLAGLPATARPITVTGTLRYNHFTRPPQGAQTSVGPAVTEAWVGLNALNPLGAAGPGLYAAPCDPDTGSFSIGNVPPGTYQLVSWDKPLDALFGIRTITVPNQPANTTYSLGNVLSFRWFGTYEGSVFYDHDADGFRDPNDQGMAQQTLNLRWRDGTVYMSTLTDSLGEFAMSEVFPFFKWLVAEVDFARFKPTGMTAVVDEGGDIPPENGWTMPSEGVRNPQPQYQTNPDGTINLAAPILNPNTGNNLSRTELSTDPAAPLLLEAVHLFLNQNSRIDWGKINYGPNENGGIAGIVGYGTTRAEEDPRTGTIDPWEAGVPRVQVVLYSDANADKIIDDMDGDGGVTLADIDNHPIGWRDGGLPGPEDVDRNGNTVFDAGDAIQIAWTDSWDDSPPTGALQPNPPVVLGKPIVGNDNFATWNQTREGVFDGGYCFGSYYPDGLTKFKAGTGRPSKDYLASGMYVVQACPPSGYLIQTEESFNVTFGDAYKPSKLLLAPELVGTPANHANDTLLARILPAVRSTGTDPNLFLVPAELSLFPGTPCSFAGQERPIADMKWVRVADGKNAAADFHIYTEVPKGTRVAGFVLNDLTAEFNPATPLYGEKAPPGFLPISFRDWAGHEIARTYSDEYGSYEALLPSTYNVAAPCPSGVAPQMLTLTLNDPTMPDPANPGRRIPDPYYNPSYSTTPWTLHYYPGTLLYADTPIVPTGGFVGGPNKQLDTEPTDGTPVIKDVTVGPIGALTYPGPYVPAGTDGAGVQTRVVNITSLGSTQVPNPNYINGAPASVPPTIVRDFGFGTHTVGDGGSVTINGVAVAEANIVEWTDARIRVRIQGALSAGASGQLMVTRGDTDKTTPIGITLTRGANSDTYAVRVVTPVDPSVQPLATPIQDVIDAANPGDLILVPPSQWEYAENPILYKAVRLQGAGLSSMINANPNPSERLDAWHAKASTILNGNATAGDPFTATEAAGVTVIGNAAFANRASRIDGFMIKGAIAGGGINVWNGAANLRISNNRITGNQGSLSGGIGIGDQAQAGIVYDNPDITIEYNQIIKNGGVTGGGGVSVFNGASGYRIRNNYIVGNFTRGSGGGISHEGRSPGGLIANNVIAFNETYYGVPAGGVAVSGDGAGIFLAGEIAAGTGLSEGAGSVTVANNLIQGNLAGTGHGGGIRAAGFNGADVEASGNQNNWYRLNIFNNIIVNNVAGYSGGGISLQDATRVYIQNNTIAWNDSTATALAAFTTDPDLSTPQGAGLVTHTHSTALMAARTPAISQAYCDPVLENNILFHNRSFQYSTASGGSLVPDPVGPASGWVYNDLQVAEGGGLLLHPTYCVLSPGTVGYGPVGTTHNVKVNPLFLDQYINDLATAKVIDEAGNNISVRSSPISLFKLNGTPLGNYHIVAGSPAIGAGLNLASVSALSRDFDGQTRSAVFDIGADQLVPGVTSIIPPAAPAITVNQVGPGPDGTAPPTTGLATGVGTPPGPAMAPLSLNPLPGDPLNPLVDPEPGVDSDGDGVANNDVAYRQLSAGDGWATMADGTDLYTFGFSDVTEIVTTETGKASARRSLANSIASITTGPLLNGGGTGTLGNSRRVQARTQLLNLAAPLPVTDPVKAQLTTLANQLVTPNNQNSGNAVRSALLLLVDSLQTEVDMTLRGISPKVLTEGLLGANLSAPTMVFKEGQHAYLDLANVGMLMRPDLFDPHTVHFHGFPQAASIFDGEPMASISVAMGGTLRYYYRIVEPGTYLYHCHVEATEHMQMGMIGNLYVYPKQNNTGYGATAAARAATKARLGGNPSATAPLGYAYNDGDGSTAYDVEAALQVTGFDKNFHDLHIAVQPLPFAMMRDDYPLLNGRGYPDTIVPGALPAPASNDYGVTSQKTTSLVTAKKGQKVLLRLSNVSETDFVTLTVSGLPMRVVAKDARLLRGPSGVNLAYNTSSITIGGGETTDVIVDTSTAAAGTYLLFSNRLNMLSNGTQDYGGIMTEIVIAP